MSDFKNYTSRFLLKLASIALFFFAVVWYTWYTFSDINGYGMDQGFTYARMFLPILLLVFLGGFCWYKAKKIQ